MNAPQKPKFLAADHVSWTVEDLESTLQFYVDVFGAKVLFRLGPLDAADLPQDARGRDWMETHVAVAGARLSLAMLRLTSNLNLQLVQYDKPADRKTAALRNCDRGGHHLGLLVEDVARTGAYLAAHGCKVMDIIEISSGPLAGKKNLYLSDPFGNSLELVD